MWPLHVGVMRKSSLDALDMKVRSSMAKRKQADIFINLQWYAFQVALAVVFVVTLYRFIKWLL